MYELSIAAKYLIPRWKQLSVSIISLVSLLVIAAVVWLVVVFFSVTNGLTNSWVDKLIALTAPVRVVPTAEYHHSYYHLVDSISVNSDYTLKTIGEKLEAVDSDPYDPTMDEELPITWKQADRKGDGTLKDPVKEVFAAINTLQDIPGISAGDYEMTAGNLNLTLLRQQQNNLLMSREQGQSNLMQSSFIGSLDPDNPRLLHALMTPSMADLSNLFASLSMKTPSSQNDARARQNLLEDESLVQRRLKAFFDNVTINELVVPEGGWLLPKHLLPSKAEWDVFIIKRADFLNRIIIPEKRSLSAPLALPKGYSAEPAKLMIDNGTATLVQNGMESKELPPYASLYLNEGAVLKATPLLSSIAEAKDSNDVVFALNVNVQGTKVQGEAAISGLKMAKAEIKTLHTAEPKHVPFWMYATKSEEGGSHTLTLPSHEEFGDGVLLPKSFHAAGVMLGDTGYLSYYAPSVSSVQEQYIPIFVAGFYDPGIIPIGGKYILTSKEITTLIRSFYSHEDVPTSNGINIRFNNVDDAVSVKERLIAALKEAEVDNYWKVETYREYEFAKDIIQQLQSEKRLYTLLATLIIIVACSNIISMLVILVNDKKLEIGILRSMGATSSSIALIFGSCGVVMGAVGSVLGTFLAFVTLKNIQPLVDFIGHMQGYEMFNPLFYGDSLPSEVSFEALTFVTVTTAVISLVAGVVPAIKACLIKPAATLKAE